MKNRWIIRTALAIGLLAMASPLRGGDKPATSPIKPAGSQPIKDLSYQFSVTPNVGDLGDKSMTALSDANPQTKVAWHRRPIVDVDFEFKGMRQLNEVAVQFYRPSQRWFLQQISLYLDDGQGFQLVDRIQTGQTYKQESIKDHYATFTFKNIGRKALRARVRFEKGGYFSVTDIQFYATAETSPADALPTKAPAATPPITEQSYRLPQKQPDQAMIQEANLDDDAETELLLANRYETLVIEPSLGGVISLLKTPGGPSYTPMKSRAQSHGGLLGDHVTSQSYRDGDWTMAKYQYEILDRGPKKVSVRLWRRGNSGVLAYLTFSKTITLYSDRDLVQVDYEISNAPEALVALPQTFWFHNFAGVPGWQKPGTLAYFYPTQNGIERLDPSSRLSRSEEQQWVLGPTRGWAALLDVPKESGLAFSVDYRYLASFYNWWSPTAIMPTLEWRFFEVPVPAGGSFKTSLRIQPYAGLTKVSGVGEQAVGQIEYENGAIQARIAPDFTGSANLTLRVRRLPQTDWREIKSQPVELTAGKTIAVQAAEQLSQDGTYVVSALLKQKDKTILSMETPVTIGKSSGSYALLPVQEQYHPQGKNRADLQYTSMDVQTPHIAWAKPYHEGKTKAVLFTANNLDRDIIELAQRMDLDFDSTYIYTTGLQWGLGDYMGRHAASQADILEGLKDLWKRSGDWQVLVLPGEAWQYLPKADQQKILDQVKQGRGLVLIEPSDETPIAQSLPVSGRGKLLTNVIWEKGSAHYITRGVPFSLLVPTDLYTYARHEGKALISAKGQPVLSVAQVGKGRVAVFEYRASADMPGKDRPAGLLPMAYGTNRDIAPPATMSKYYEYQFSLLVRSILWAAHRESPVALETATPADGQTTLQITNDGDAVAARITWTLRDANGRPLGVDGEKTEQLNKGKQDISLAIALPMARGSLDVWVRDAKGRVLDWGSYAFSLKTPVALAEVTPDRDHLTPDGPLNLKVKLSAAPPQGTQLRVTLTDGFGRVVNQISQKADGAEQEVALKLDHLLNRMMEIRVSLWNGRELDSRLLALPVQFALRTSPHDDTEPYLLPWNGAGVPNRSFGAYLFEPILKQLRNLGTNAAIVNPQEVMNEAVLDSMGRANMSLFMKNSGIGNDHVAKGSDPDHPHRAAELYEKLDGSINTVQRYARSFANRNAVDFIAGDEGHLGERGVEMSFAPSYLAQFRQWLQKKYASLDKLNGQWGTSFGSWEKVMPSTLKELQSKRSRNYSSWCDFRAFGDYSVAYYYGRMTRAANEALPNLRMSISGTPYPSPFIGYDYWLLSKSLSSIQAYSGMDELVDFAGRKMDLMKWASGHGLAPPAVKFTIFNQFFRGGTGLSIYSARLLLKPDLRYSTYGQSFVKYYKPIRDGVGRLLIGSTITRDKVAVLYSQNSMRLAYAMGEYDLWKQSNESAIKLLQNMGFDPAWISYEQLSAGKLKPYDVLVLPASSSLDKAQVAAIKEFAQRGGTVIGAMRTGLADGFGKLNEQGSLDELFGIRRSGTELARGEWTLQGEALSQVPAAVIEAGISAAGAQVAASIAGGGPILFHRQVGKGQAWYVAYDLLPQYAQFNAARTIRANAEHMDRIESLAGGWLTQAGLKPLVEVKDQEGKPLPFVKRTHFVDGLVNYYAVLRDYPTASGMSVKPTMSQITLPKKQYIYEILSEKKYGLTDHVQMIAGDDAAMLFAALPYQVTALEISSDREHPKLGETTTLSFSVKADAKVGTHVLHVDVIDPSGQVSEAYSQNLTAREGRATMAWPIALNDAAGRWTVRVIDLTSGTREQKMIEIGK